MKKLPDSEFEIMKKVWQLPSPVTARALTPYLDTAWKPTTILTFLLRLTKKGFLQCEKCGKENIYTPLITEEEYLRFESKDFIERYQKPSVLSLISTLYDGEKISEAELDQLDEWLAMKKKNAQ